MMRFTGMVVLMAFGFVATGCATIVSGSTQDVGFQTNPTGANIIVDGFPHGTTPATVHLDRGDDHTVALSLDGYQPLAITLHRNINGWVWGNILLGGIIGLVVDVGTGALYTLTPETIDVALAQSVAITDLSGSDDFMITAALIRDTSGLEKVGQLQLAK